MRHDVLDKTDAVFSRYLDLGREPEFVTRSAKGLPVTDTPWTQYAAPCADAWGRASSGDTRGLTSASHSENRASGAINCTSYSRLVGADDSDSGWTRAMIEIRVGFRMPAAGMVEAWVTLQDVETGMNGRLRDESGCPDGSVRQISRADIWTNGGVERYQTIRERSERTDGSDRSWNIP